MGFGGAVALLIDATIVRLVVVAVNAAAREGQQVFALVAVLAADNRVEGTARASAASASAAC